MDIIPYESRYRDDMIFMVLSAKDAIGHPPKINPDLLTVEETYLTPGDAFLLAVEQDRVVGCIGYSSIPGTTEVILHRLYVKPERKHQGIGSALLTAAEADCRSKGKTAAHVHLGAPKEKWFESYAFYAKHGYVEDSPRHVKKNFM